MVDIIDSEGAAVGVVVVDIVDSVMHYKNAKNKVGHFTFWKYGVSCHVMLSRVVSYHVVVP